MQRLFRSVFIGFDWLTAALSWALFYYYRKTVIEHVEFQYNETFYYGILVIPILWLMLYAIQGTYIDIRRLYRLKILSHTTFATIFGSIILFFTLLLDDEVTNYHSYYRLLLALTILHFGLTFVVRIILTSIQVKRIHSKKEGFRTLLIGGSEKAVQIYNEVETLSKSGGNNFVGFVNLNGIDKLLENRIPYLGHVNTLEEVLKTHQIEEVIIALESVEHERLQTIISRINNTDIVIKVLPDMYDILSGSVKLDNIFGALLMVVNAEVMPPWQQALKRFIDLTASLIALILLIPVYFILAIAVAFSSKGPVFFLQERIGINGRIFKIVKFRTMFVDAEKLGPQLSSTHDPRITNVGRFMRKTRLDELPQFYNVIIGDMSLVGPRPERQFYIDQIAQVEPQFLELTKVRPGITSWGQVKYGYAENVEQMIQRMKYDLLYLRNRSIALDIKIMLYTILIVLKAKGK
ncbi:MAG: sugar transferase [Fluviicola sp.]|nr:sugar transferase [Fluviicola sp.]MBP6272414.1 sugar transferase [Fluviicola sp.]